MRCWWEWEKCIDIDNDYAPTDCNLTDDATEDFDLDEKALRQLQIDDPKMYGLNINRENWIEGAGSAIGRSKYLVKLVIDIDAPDSESDSDEDEDEKYERWVVDIFQGLSHNQSIRTFHLTGAQSYAIPGLNRHDLGDFIGRNSTLQSVNVSFLSEKSFEEFVSALIGCKGSNLKRLEVNNCVITDAMGARFFESLEDHHNLLELYFYSNEMESMKQSGPALSKLLKLHASKIHHILICGKKRWLSWCDDCIVDLSAALEVNTTLSSLTVEFQDATRSWRSFSRALSKTECSLKWLDLSDNKMDDDAMTCLGDGLATNTTLQYLNISENSDITVEGWQGFVTCFRNPLSALKRININSCNIRDEGAFAFASALANNSTSASLHMARNRISSTGWVLFFNTLLTSNSSFEHLTLHDNELTEKICWDALACTICDASSIESIFSSNHSFFNIGSFYYPIDELVKDAPDNVRSLLGLNNLSCEEAARRKILKYYFSGGNRNLHEFSRMPMTSMPFAVEWIGRNKLGFSLMYSLVQSNPSVFAPGPLSAVRKRKRKGRRRQKV